MSLWRKNPRRDDNEAAIVEALEAVGATNVTRVSGKGAPDLIFAFQGRLYALEVKSKTGKRTKAQERSLWPIVRTVAEALTVIGVLRP